MPSTFDLSTTAADVLSDRLRINTRLAPLSIPFHGATIAERTELTEKVMRDLRDQGLAGPRHLDDDVEDGLMTLARAEVSLSLVLALDAGRGMVIGRVATTRQLAVMVLQRQNTLRFTLARPAAMVDTLLTTVPNCRPVQRFGSVTFPRTEPKPRPSPDENVDTPVLSPVRPARTGHQRGQDIVRQFLKLPRERAGAISVYGPGRADGELTGEPIIWFDTSSGRVVQHARREPDGAVWEVYFAADNRRLATEITNAMALAIRDSASSDTPFE
jgi:hypothetical protein